MATFATHNRTAKATVSRRIPKGFTLVELLVVITIIALLVGMLIPAIQSAREAGRRTSCQNNLHQIALAVTEFHDDLGHFPQGQCAGKFGFGPESMSWSWMARILPYIEERDLYKSGSIFSDTLAASGIANKQVRLFLCPSDAYSWRGPRTDAGNLGGFAVGQTNYKAVSGANWGTDVTLPNHDIFTLFPNPGTNGSSDGMNDGDGVMWRSDYTHPIQHRDVTDGLSHTFMIGEDLPQKNDWCSWPYANNAYGTCAIPPNYTYRDPDWWPNTQSFRSAHPAGLNFSMCDGATLFVSAEIDMATYRALATRAGGENTGNF